MVLHEPRVGEDGQYGPAQCTSIVHSHGVETPFCKQRRLGKITQPLIYNNQETIRYSKSYILWKTVKAV